MDWNWTIASLTMASAALGLSIWQTARPRRDSLRVRWIPWRFMVLLSAACIFLCILYLLHLLGYTAPTQQPF